MMDLRMEVYSPALELLGVLEIQRSVIWEERAFSAGSFSLESLVSDESRALLTPENIIWIEGDTAGIIEYVLREASAEGPYITVKGRTLTGILDRRILWGQYDLYGYAPDLMRQLVDDCCIHPTRGDLEARIIPGLALEDNVDPGPVSRLPDGYTELKYIESSGTQYIDTGFLPTTETRVIADVEVLSADGTKGIFGARDENSGTASKMFCFWVRTATQFRSDYFGTQQSANVENAFSRVLVDKDKNVTKIGDVSVTNSPVSEARSCEKSLFLFNINPGSYGSTARLYSLRIINNGEVCRDYAPCKAPDGAIGLYDLTGESFYANAGTGTFIAGPNVQPSSLAVASEKQKIRKQQTGGTLLEALEEIGEAYGVAFGVRFNPKIPLMEFWTRWGQDRSIGQSVNEPVFYSTELDDVLSSEYSYNSTDYRNVSLVAGEGEGANRVFTTVIAQPTEPPPAPPTPPTPDTFTIALDVDPTGGGTASGGGTYKDGVSITVSATPSPNYEFSGWREDGTIVSTNESYSFTVSKNRTLTAVFSSTVQTYTVTATVDPSGSGTVQGAGTYQAGATATIKATPGDGYKFTAWKEGGVVVSSSAEYTFTVNGNRAFVAAFESAAVTVLNWQSITLPASSPWSFGCHGNGIFVISPSDELTSSYSRKMLFSLDGISFELSNSAYRSGTTGGIAYGNNLFVSPKCYKTSSAGSIQTMSPTSENGKTWALNPSALQSNQWQSIACGKDADGEDLFVVVASNSKYSAYGKTGASWTRKTILPSAQDWIAVAYGGGEFVAIAYDSDKAAHGPGISAAWVESTLPSSAKWRGLAYGGGKFVAVSEDGAIAYSSDGGNTWASASVPEALALHCVAYGNGMFVAPAYGSDKYLYSENGVTWKIGNMPVSGNWKAITYGSGKFVAACYKSNAAAYAEF